MNPSSVAGVSGQVAKLEEEARTETQNVVAELKTATSRPNQDLGTNMLRSWKRLN
jgi:hypothetical protein